MAVNKPPITTVANGFTSPPRPAIAPWAKSLMRATKAVMITGRKQRSAFDYNLLYIGHSFFF
jgi:hypothetical protein